MLYQTLLATPVWVWGMLALLILLGLSITRARQSRLRRVVLLPLVISVLSLHGTFSVFQGTPLNWVMWAGALALSTAWFGTGDLPAGVSYDAATRVFTQPGSWSPLAMMLGIFAIRYATAVTLALYPSLALDAGTAAMAASLYGALSGVFLGHMARMLRVSLRKEPSTPVPTNASSTVAWG